MTELERIIAAYPQSLVEAWLTAAEAKYLKSKAKREANKKPNINKLLGQLNLDELRKRI